jgi:hypothetical protein
MKQTLMTLAAGIGLALPLFFAAIGPASAQERGCLSDRQIMEAIDAGDISPPSDVLRENGIDKRPLSFQVCGEESNRNYIFNIEKGQGEYDSIPLPAGGD